MQNNSGFINNTLKKFLLLSMVLAISACGGSKSTAPVGEGGLGDTDGGGGTTVTVGTVTVTAGSGQISVGGTTIVTATVLDTDGNSVPDSTIVTFSLDDTTYGSLSDTSGTITATASTTDGQATVTFTASTTNAGTAVVTATASDQSDTVNIMVIGAVGSVSVVATPAEVIVGTGQSSVSATVLDTDGIPVASGTQVTFSVDNSALGTITSTATTDDNGIARATFTAGSSTAGVVTITATAGGRSGTAQITVNGAETGSIFFVSADPSIIGIKRVGQGEFSTIKFAVKDVNGHPVLDGEAIDICLLVHPFGKAGQGVLPVDGGEYINEDDDVVEDWVDSNINGCYETGETYTDSNGNDRYDSPFHATVSTVDGEAIVYLHSGIKPGNVTLLATVVDTGISSVTSILSIGGGIPSYYSFSVAAKPLNIKGFEEFFSVTSTISVGVADRFDNREVLEGTTVSFMTEAGAIERAGILDNKGETTVEIRAQRPYPEDVAPKTWETLLFYDVLNDYGIPVPCLPPDPLPDPLPDRESTAMACIPLDPMPENPAGQPRDGLLSITVSINGEEGFRDCNGNGLYDDTDVDCDDDGIADDSEPFEDTLDEIFIDYNDNGVCDVDTTSQDPVELYLDYNQDNYWTGANGQWDDFKTLFRTMPLLYTGRPSYYTFSVNNQNTTGTCPSPTASGDNWNPPGSLIICDGESFQFKVLVSDHHLNPLLAGTTIKVSVTGDVDLFGTTEVKMLDTSIPGPVEMYFSVADKTPDDTDPPKPFTLTVTVTWEGDKYENAIRGEVD